MSTWYTIIFKIDGKYSKKRHTDIASEIDKLLSYPEEKNISELNYNSSKKRYELIGDTINDNWEEIFNHLKTIGIEDCYAKLIPDNSDSELYIALVNGGINQYPDLDELYNDQNKTLVGDEFYKIIGNSNSVLIRWGIKGKKLEKINNIFSDCLSSLKTNPLKAVDSLCENLNELTKSTDPKRRANFPHIEGDDGPLDLLQALCFVKVDGDYLYLGFTPDEIDSDKIEIMVFAMSIVGPQKIWIKMRWAEEGIVYLAPMDEPTHFEPDLAENDNWPI